METPKEPWNFCETPEEKCTMNYCDENGCQSRKRNLVEPKKSKAATFILGQIDKAIEKSNLEQQIEKTETLYRKVTFEINDKDHDEIWLIGKSANFIFNPNTRNGEELSDFLAGCEEITDNSHQIEKLEADKTLYRKVAISERLPEKGEYLTDLGIRYLDGYKNWQLSEFSKKKKVNENHEEYFEEPDFWLEPIPDHTAQLQADKAELLEALEKVKRLEPIICMGGAVAEQWQNEDQALNEMMAEIESLIQKHKQ